MKGTIVKGAGRATYFTGLSWVQKQCTDKLGFKPYPGTLNVELSPDDARLLENPPAPIVELTSPDPAFCNARALPVSVGPLSGALILPAEDVKIHAPNIVEIICPVHIKDSLGVEDGAAVTITLRNR